MSTDSLISKLRESIEDGEWSWLAPHQARGALVLVSQDLDLAEVGSAISRDSVSEVSTWLQQGKLLKPGPTQIDGWDATPALKFRFLIVQPYVLVQVRSN